MHQPLRPPLEFRDSARGRRLVHRFSSLSSGNSAHHSGPRSHTRAISIHPSRIIILCFSCTQVIVHRFSSFAVVAIRITPGRPVIRVPSHLIFRRNFITLHYFSCIRIIVNYDPSSFALHKKPRFAKICRQFDLLASRTSISFSNSKSPKHFAKDQSPSKSNDTSLNAMISSSKSAMPVQCELQETNQRRHPVRRLGRPRRYTTGPSLILPRS